MTWTLLLACVSTRAPAGDPTTSPISGAALTRPAPSLTTPFVSIGLRDRIPTAGTTAGVLSVTRAVPEVSSTGPDAPMETFMDVAFALDRGGHRTLLEGFFAVAPDAGPTEIWSDDLRLVVSAMDERTATISLHEVVPGVGDAITYVIGRDWTPVTEGVELRAVQFGKTEEATLVEVEARAPRSRPATFALTVGSTPATLHWHHLRLEVTGVRYGASVTFTGRPMRLQSLLTL